MSHESEKNERRLERKIETPEARLAQEGDKVEQTASVGISGDVSGQLATGETVTQIDEIRDSTVTIEKVDTKIVHETPTPPPPYTPPLLPDPDTLPDPGSLPPGSRLPFTRNAIFTGRVEPLKTLARTLLHGGAPSTLITQVVRGMGGVGKTQLAVEFVYRYGRFFHGVHWIDGAQPGAIGTEIAACGAEMGLPNWPDKQPDQVRRTLDEWQRGGPRLVILDNLEDVDAVQEWLTRLSDSVRLLLTARRRNWPATLGLDLLPLDVFTPWESREFLRRRLRETDADLYRLAERLDHLPLALELTGRYLENVPTLAMDVYLQKLEKIWDHPSMTGWREELVNPTGHDLDLAATFAVSWERVPDENARRLFLLAGYCAPNRPIPPELLERASALEVESFGEALGVLVGMGLLEMEDAKAGPMIHPLLAEYARTLPLPPFFLPPLPSSLSTLTAVLVTLTHQVNESGLPVRFAPLRPHAEAVAAAAEKADLDWTKRWELHFELGRALIITGEFDKALDHMEKKAWDLLTDALEKDTVLLRARVCYEIGRTYVKKGDLGTASEWQGKGLALLPEEPLVEAARLHLLGAEIGASQADLDRIERESEQARSLAETIGAKPELALAHRSLASAARVRGDLNLAMEHLEISIEIWKELSNLVELANAYGNLGILSLGIGDWLRAEASYLGAHETYKRMGSKFELAITCCNLGDLYCHRGDVERGLAYAQRGLEIADELEAYPVIIFAHTILGTLFWRRRDMEQAHAELMEARGLIETHGIRLFETTVARWLAQVYLTEGDVTQAEAAIEPLLPLTKKDLDVDYEPVQRLWGQILAAQGNLDDAIQVLQDSLTRLEDGEELYQTGRTLLALADVLAQEAKAHAGRARAIFADLGARLDLQEAEEFITRLGK